MILEYETFNSSMILLCKRTCMKVSHRRERKCASGMFLSSNCSRIEQTVLTIGLDVWMKWRTSPMSRPNSPPSTESPHLVSLVLQSKKALQHGEQLCSRAHDLSFKTSEVAAELLALDAKARWIAQGILDQLKVCTFDALR